MQRISVIGLGYIGLPTAAMFASHGVKVTGVEINEDICNTINNGGIHIQEPFLADIVRKQVSRGMIKCVTEVKPSEAFLIAVPTPIKQDKTADLSYVVSAGQAVAKVLKPGDLVILESTVPPRCTLDVLLPILEKSRLKAGKDFSLAHCPERVLPGNIIHELKYNDRVIGGINPESAEKSRDLYAAFVKGEMYLTDTITAELCKLMENTYRDVNIALANELARISERLGTNAWDVIKYANKHPRVNIHQPGPGVGGHCLAVDPWFVATAAPDLASIIQLARNTNDFMPSYVAKRVEVLVGPGSKVVVLGCTYKPDVDDLRGSPILDLIKLLGDDYNVTVVDPFVESYNVDVYKAAKKADLIVLGVHHDKFKKINLSKLAEIMNSPVLLDTRNFFSRDKVEQAGFEYHLLGSAKRVKVRAWDTKRKVAASVEKDVRNVLKC
ncbi:MAG: nucleotide sugar dehydrogenase [Firmicutes bacterium]|nr:nucleotide sugar dehydrogenase [Bacillota bacterium]